MRIPSNDRYLRTTVQQRHLFTTAFLICLVVAAFCVIALPGSAVGPAGAAQKVYDDWVAANEAVKEATGKLKAAKEKQATVMANTASGGITEGEQRALAKARQEVADAEAELKDAEARLAAARKKLEDAIVEQEDEKLKKELIRKRDGYIASQRFPSIASVSADAVTASGMRTATFATPNGSVKVHLPDDMAAGDTISGTVIAEPKGGTPEERSKNMDELRGYVIDIAPTGPNPRSARSSVGRSDLFVASIPDTNPNQLVSVITFVTPEKFDMNLFLMPNQNSPVGPCGRSGPLVAINESCSPISQLVFTPPPRLIDTSTPTVPTSTPTFVIPSIGQQGRPVEITGPFDGNSANTTVRVTTQDFEKNTENVSGGFGLIRPLVESRNRIVFQAPTNVTGPSQLTLKEGTGGTTGQYRNVGVRLSAPKTNLLRGERTTLTVEVSGLEGIKEPVPLTLASTGVITMQDGTFQTFTIQPSQVGAGGLYSTTRAITGVQPGSFTVTATVVVDNRPKP